MRRFFHNILKILPKARAGVYNGRRKTESRLRLSKFLKEEKDNER